MDKTRTSPPAPSASLAISRGSFAFSWRVPIGGFSWRKDLVVTHFDRPKGYHLPEFYGPTAWLVPRAKPGPDTRFPVRAYAPLFKPGLYRQFARVKPTKEGILQFANKHGFLGLAQADLSDPKSKHPNYTNPGEPLWLWQGEIGLLRRLVGWFDLLIRLRNTEKLPASGTPVAWRSKPSQYVVLTWNQDGQQREEFIASRGSHSHLFSRWAAGETAGPLTFYLCDTVNGKLWGHLSWQLVQGDGPRGFWPAIFPDSLLAALYLGFANDLAGLGPLRRCAASDCENLFPACGKTRFCSKTCRWRTWKRESRKPAASGAGEGRKERDHGKASLPR